MQTKQWDIHAHALNSNTAHRALDEVSTALLAGEIIGIPTETVYGLAADARNDEAIKKVFRAKGRPSDNPLIVHIHDVSQLEDFTTYVDDKARLLMSHFWPGPLSIILPLKKGVLSERATAGLNTVAVRMPSHPVARAVLKHVNIPIAAPSANTSGKPSPTDAGHVTNDLDGKIFGIIAGESSVVGLESTVIDCTVHPYRIVRSGSITRRNIEEILNEDILIEKSGSETPVSPGMKYRHYAPRQPIHVVENWADIGEQVKKESRSTGVIAPRTVKRYINSDVLFIELCEHEEAYEEAAHNLYRVLRELDESEAEVLYIHGFLQNEASAALNDRIYRAAGKKNN